MHEARGSLVPSDKTHKACRNMFGLIGRRPHANLSENMMLNAADHFENPAVETVNAFPEYTELFQKDVEFFTICKKVHEMQAVRGMDENLLKEFDLMTVNLLPRLAFLRKYPFNEEYMAEYQQAILRLKEWFSQQE